MIHLLDMNTDAAPYLAGAKWTFVTRRVRRSAVHMLDGDIAAVRPGDLILAEVQSMGSHKRVQLSDGRYSALFPRDRVVLACADRFAEDQFEGLAALSPGGVDLLAGGGVIGLMQSRNGRVKCPTRLSVIARLADADGRVLNLDRFAVEAGQMAAPARVIGVLGTGMNAGKTAAAAGLVNGLARYGDKVAALKATGTGSFGDVHLYEAAGALRTLDFTDAGLASTYRQPVERLDQLTRTLLSAVADCDVAVVELADGVSQVETAALLARPAYRALFDAFVLAAPSALAARGGLAWLAAHDVTPMALTGLMTQAPLARREAEDLGLPVLSREDLSDPATALSLHALWADASTEHVA